MAPALGDPPPPALAVAPPLPVGACVGDALPLPEGEGASGVAVGEPPEGVPQALAVGTPEGAEEPLGGAEPLADCDAPPLPLAQPLGVPEGGGDAVPVPAALPVGGAVAEAEGLPE